MRGRKGNETNFPQSIYKCLCAEHERMQPKCNSCVHLKSQLLLIAPGMYKHVPKRFKHTFLEIGNAAGEKQLGNDSGEYTLEVMGRGAIKTTLTVGQSQ